MTSGSTWNIGSRGTADNHDALSKSVVIGREGRIARLKLAAELGMSVARPSMPPMIEKYLEAERLMHEHVDAWSCTSDS